MPRWTRWTVFVLLLAVFMAAVYLPSLRRHANQLRKSERTQGEALREIEQPKIATPTDVKVKAKLFWAMADNQGTLAPVEIELGLSADPVLRAKQVLDTLIAGPVDSDLRTLPSDAVLLTARPSPIFPKPWPRSFLPAFKANSSPSIPSRAPSKPMCLKSAG